VTGRSGAAGRAVWNLIDQIISSVTNAALSFLVARSVSDTAFGGFAVAFTVFALLVGAIRAGATSPLGIRFADRDPSTFRRAAASATGTAAAVGLVAGAGCVVAGIAIGGVSGPALLALGVVLPGLLVQESWRQVFFAQGRPAAAALNDVVWGVAQFAAVAALLLTGHGTVGPLILAWGGAAAAAAVLGARQARTVPALRRARSWLREHRDLTGYTVAEFATLQGVQQAALLVIATIGSLEAIGALRGVQVLLGPATILGTATLNFTIPEFARRRGSLTRRQWVTSALGTSTVIAVLTASWGVLFLLAPGEVGHALLGPTWPDTSSILWPTVLGQIGATLGVGPAALLYAMDRARVTLLVHSVYAPLVFIGGIGGVLLGGAFGAACGFAAAFWLVLPLWWLRFWQEADRFGRRNTEIRESKVV
jgi:O-antigen/teichoic acid export membrane protein